MSEIGYRLLALGCFAAFMLVRVHHARRMGGGGGSLDPGAEGRLLMVVDRLLILLNTLGVAVYIVHPALIAAFRLDLPDAARVAGLGACLWGILLFAWSLSTLGQHASLSLTIREDHRLVEEGPYKWVRHPMYTAFLLIYGGFFLLAANWLIGLNALLGYGLVKMVLRTPREERMLLDAFGDEYRAYMARTGRFVGIGARLRMLAGRS